MAVRRVDEKQDEKATILRVTVPKTLMTELRETKKWCRDHGFRFDIKPDIRRAIESAIADAKKTVEAELKKRE